MQHSDPWYNGWEHFVQGSRDDDKRNWPSRLYYHICLGLFFAFPPATYALACVYKAGNVLLTAHELHFPAWFGIGLYLAFVVFAVFYIRSILSLADSFGSGKNSSESAEEVTAGVK